MKAYIQKIDKDFTDDWMFSAYLGCKQLGMDVIFFEEIEEVPKNQFVVCFIEDTIKYLELAGIEIPIPLNIPEELMKYTNREINTANLQDIISQPELFIFPIFIKPYAKLKAFSSGVLSKPTGLSLIFSDVKDKNQLAQISSVVPMLSEYRCFIKNKRIIGIRHYSGDFKLFPNIDQIEKMVVDYVSSPIAYTLDVAISTHEVGPIYYHKTILVECNDGWSVANYGLDGETYVNFLLARWKELTKK